MINKMNETSDEEYAKHAVKSIKQLFKANIFAAIVTIFSIAGAAYIIFGSDENIKFGIWALIFILNLPTLLNCIKTTIRTRNFSWSIVGASIIAAYIAIIFRLFGVIGDITAVILFFALPLVSLIPVLLSERRDIFKSVIIKEGEKIDAMTDGYSERPYSKESAIIKEIKNFKEDSIKFAKMLGKEGIVIDYNVKEDKVIMFPSMPFDFGSGSLSFPKKRNSFIEIHKNGSIVAFISRSDYLQIILPVSHHLLCQNVTEKFEKSFIEFAKGDKEGAIKILRVNENE